MKDLSILYFIFTVFSVERRNIFSARFTIFARNLAKIPSSFFHSKKSNLDKRYLKDKQNRINN